MRNKMIHLAIFANAHAIVGIFCLIMVLFGYATPFLDSFAVDSQENLYVGEGKTIGVYQNGIRQRTIQLKSTTCVFAIDANDELIVASSSVVTRMLTTGEVIDTKEDPQAETYQKIINENRIVRSANGDEYKKVSTLGWTRIIKNGSEEVYRISILSFAVKLLLYIVALSLCCNGIWFIRRFRSNRDISPTE